jgi:hypothetical protein
MTKELLDIINAKYPLKELEAGEFSKMKVSGMTFNITAYHAQGLGHVSVMSAKGFFGLMKMDTIIIVPQELDLPLYSYDQILAMGNNSLYLELYDTVAGNCDVSALDAVKQQYAGVPDFDPGKHWYDNIKLAQSVFKKGKNAQIGTDVNKLATEYLKKYLELGASLADATNTNAGFDKAEKCKKTEYYVNGLIKNGGPSTDVFKKKFGEQKTGELFTKVLFGTAL